MAKNNKFPVSGHFIGRLQNRCSDAFFFFFFFANVIHVYMRLLEPDQVSQLRWLRGASQIGQMFKTQQGRIPLGPAILAAIRHCFIAQKKNLKTLTRGSEVTRPDTRKRRLFFCWPILENSQFRFIEFIPMQNLEKTPLSKKLIDNNFTFIGNNSTSD